MTTFDWVLLASFAALVVFILVRRKSPTAKEIAKEVVLASEKAVTERVALVCCGRCMLAFPEWFTENFGTESMKENICLNCSQGMDPPAHGQTEDDYVDGWKEKKRLREQVEGAIEPPRSVFGEPPRGDT